METMADSMIYVIIGMAVAFFLGTGFGFLWGLSRHEWLYLRVTAYAMHRMRQVMESLGIEGWKVDKAMERMGTAVVPPSVPRPAPPEAKERDFRKEPYTVAEVERRLSPHGDCHGELYCTVRQPYIAWSIDKVDADGTIARKTVHNLREHTVENAPAPHRPETICDLAESIVRYGFRFLSDFDTRQWDGQH